VTGADATVIVLLALALVAHAAYQARLAHQREERGAFEVGRLVDKLIVLQAASPEVAKQATTLAAAAAPVQSEAQPTPAPAPHPTASPAIHDLGPARVEPSDVDNEEVILAHAEAISARRLARHLEARG